MNIINEFRNGDLSIFKSIASYDKKEYIELIKNSEYRDEILNKIIPQIIDNDEYKLANYIFEIIYKDEDYKDYTKELIDKKIIDFKKIKEKLLKDILNNTEYGFEFVYNNLEDLFNEKLNKEKNNNIGVVTDYFKDKYFEYRKILNKVLDTDNQRIKDRFITSSLADNIQLFEDDIIKTIYNNGIINNSIIPFFISKTHKFEHMRYKKLMLREFKKFFMSELNRKMELININQDEINLERLKKYKKVFELYKSYEDKTVDLIISNLINNDDIEFLNEIIDDNVSFIGRGTTTVAYKTGSKVIKFTRQKHQQIQKPINLFLLAPTYTKNIYDKEGNITSIIEIQDYLSKEHNGKKICEDDIKYFYEELDKLGYIATDPLCYQLKEENFGFLNDYHDADITGFNSTEELPERFKERPIVLYDIDLIYKKDDPNKKILKFTSF